MTDDACLRRVLKARLAAQKLAPGAAVLDEVTVGQGTGRVDVMQVDATGIHGYELKSGRDTLSRFWLQVDCYNEVFDTLTLVTVEKHRQSALALINDWWGLWLVAGEGLMCYRPARPNPKQSPFCLAQLLDAASGLALLQAHQVSPRDTRPRSVWKAMADQLSLATIRQAVITRWLGAGQPLPLVGG